MLDKNTNAGHFLITVSYIFSKYVHNDVIISRKNKR